MIITSKLTVQFPDDRASRCRHMMTQIISVSVGFVNEWQFAAFIFDVELEVNLLTRKFIPFFNEVYQSFTYFRTYNSTVETVYWSDDSGL